MGNGDEKKNRDSYGSPKSPDSLKYILLKDSSYKNQGLVRDALQGQPNQSAICSGERVAIKGPGEPEPPQNPAYVVDGVGSNEPMDSDLSMIHHLNDDIRALSERVTTQKSSIRKERHEVDLETTWETRKSKRKVAFSASPEWAAMNDDSFASTVEVDKMVDEALDVMAMRVIERASKWASQKNASLYEAQDQIAFLRRSLEEVHPQKEEEHANASRAQAEVKELCLRAQADAKSTQAEVLKAHAEAKDAHFQKEAAQAEVLAMKVRDRRSQIATSLGILPVPQTSQGPSTSEFERLRSRVILYWSECQRLRAERDHALHEHASSAAVVIALETALAIGGSDPSPIIDRALARCPRPPPLERTQSLAISGCSLRVGAGGSRKVESTSRPRADDQEAASSHRSSRGRSSHSPGF